jgi:Tfp pilus assembly protein PilO
MKLLTATRWRWWPIDAAGAGICLAATLMAYLLGIAPVLKGHASYASQQSEVTARREEYRGLCAKIKGLQDRLAAVRKALSESPLRLRTASQTNSRLAEMGELAAQCKLKVDEIEPGKVQPGPRYEIVPIRLTGQGAFPSCVQFLRRLREKYPDIGGVRIELNSKAEGAEPVAGFEFHLEWYAAPAVNAAK